MSQIRKQYPSDLNDEQWSIIEDHIPPAKLGGRPRKVDMREIINGIFYLLRSGCAWRMLPNDLPRWQTVYWYFRKFKRAGVWEDINSRLREQVRVAEGREATPSAAIIDSQSVKTTEKGGPAVMMQERKSMDANATSSWMCSA